MSVSLVSPETSLHGLFAKINIMTYQHWAYHIHLFTHSYSGNATQFVRLDFLSRNKDEAVVFGLVFKKNKILMDYSVQLPQFQLQLLCQDQDLQVFMGLTRTISTQ